MSQSDLIKDYDKQQRSKLGRKHCRDSRLNELEQQLEFAESRCGTLKQQLDYIKLLYGCDRVPACGNSNDENEFNENGHGDGLDLKRLSYDDLPAWSIQNAAHGGGEGGKCSIKQASSFTNTNRTTNSSNKFNSSKSSLFKKENSPEEAPYWKPKTNLKLSKVKKKKTVKPKSKSKIKPSPKCSQTDPVVTIYKNTAAKMDSETVLEVNKQPKSDSKTVMKKSKKNLVDDMKLETIPSHIKSLNLFNVKVTSKTVLMKEESVQTETVEKAPENLEVHKEIEEIIPSQVEYEAEKNYSQPTIASKSKQVDRNMWANLNVKNIPFIAATSTAPSHNIGVNIQQVLSIIKKRQPTNENNQNVQNPNLIHTMLNSKKSGMNVNSNEEILIPQEKDSKKNIEVIKSSMSFWQSGADLSKDKNNEDLTDRVRQLKKVLVFLHEDFSNLSLKYKKLQKKLTKRNIDKNEAKEELAEIEKSLERKEEEIIVIIGLYKEVLSLRDELRKVQDKYNFVSSGKNSTGDAVIHSNSAHCQMSTLLRKIQNFQEKLKQY